MVTKSVETECLPTSRLCIMEMLVVLLLMAPMVVPSLAAAVTVVALLLTGRRMSSRRPSPSSSVRASSRSLIFLCRRVSFAQPFSERRKCQDEKCSST